MGQTAAHWPHLTQPTSPRDLPNAGDTTASPPRYAKSIAPVDEGDYRDGIRVGRRGNRGVAIEFSDYKSHWVEFGTEDQEPNPVRAKTENHLQQTENAK